MRSRTKSEGPASSPTLARARQTGGKWGDRDRLKTRTGSARSCHNKSRFELEERHSMKNSEFVGGLIALSLALPFAVATGSAEPSAKATAETSSLVLLPATSGTGAWVDLLSSTIKTPNGKELFITAAFEAGLFTHTEAEGGDISQAQATVQVRVLVDGAEVNPGPVVYANRIQTLTSHLD